VAGIVLMCIGVATLQFVLEEGPRDDWFASPVITALSAVAAVALAAFIIRELTAVAPVVNLRLFRDKTFAAGTAIGGVMFAMLMGTMFLLPVFMQEVLGFDATQSGNTLMPRTLAMMVVTPFIGRLYNRVPPALIVAAGGVFSRWARTSSAASLWRARRSTSSRRCSSPGWASRASSFR